MKEDEEELAKGKEKKNMWKAGESVASLGKMCMAITYEGRKGARTKARMVTKAQSRWALINLELVGKEFGLSGQIPAVERY